MGILTEDMKRVVREQRLGYFAKFSVSDSRHGTYILDLLELFERTTTVSGAKRKCDENQLGTR